MRRSSKSSPSPPSAGRQRPLSQVFISARTDEVPAPSRFVGRAGLRAQQFTLGTSTFDYEWSGREHYLALHDICLKEGEALLDDRRAGAQLRDLRGRLTFIPAGRRIRGWSAPTDRTNLFTAIYFDPRSLDEDIAQCLTSVELNPDVYFVEPALATTLGRIQAELQQGSADTLYVESLCIVAALELVRHQRMQGAVTQRPPGTLSALQVKLVREYIESRLAEEVSLTELADLVQLSQFHFLRAFKKSTGDTPYQYVLKRRIERAQALLRVGGVPIKGVGAAVGFNSAARFIRAFKKYYGLTPGAFVARVRDNSHGA